MEKRVIGIEDFNSCGEFLKWFMDEDGFHKKLSFEEASKEVSKMKVLYDFLMDYYIVRKKCIKKMEEYNSLYSMEDNKFLEEAMRQFVINNSSGKNLRAFLVSLGYHSFGNKDDDYIYLSLALELFQTSILIHDDIIDKALFRRGVPTIPERYKKIYSDFANVDDGFETERDNVANSMAFCIGDLGLYLANQMIVKNYIDNPKLGEVLKYYNDIAIKTCKGEMLDVIVSFYERFYGGLSDLEGQIIDIYKFKTGWYSVVGPFALGAILGGATEEQLEKIEDALLGLGIAYQIKDDILGVFGDEEKLGKPVISDVEEFKQTILYAYTIRTSYKDELLKYYGKNADITKVRDIFEKSGALKYAKDYMNRIFQDSFDAILVLDFLDFKYKKILLGFAEYLKERDN